MPPGGFNFRQKMRSAREENSIPPAQVLLQSIVEQSPIFFKANGALTKNNPIQPIANLQPSTTPAIHKIHAGNHQNSRQKALKESQEKIKKVLKIVDTKSQRSLLLPFLAAMAQNAKKLKVNVRACVYV